MLPIDRWLKASKKCNFDTLTSHRLFFSNESSVHLYTPYMNFSTTFNNLLYCGCCIPKIYCSTSAKQEKQIIWWIGLNSLEFCHTSKAFKAVYAYIINSAISALSRSIKSAHMSSSWLLASITFNLPSNRLRARGVLKCSRRPFPISLHSYRAENRYCNTYKSQWTPQTKSKGKVPSLQRNRRSAATSDSQT